MPGGVFPVLPARRWRRRSPCDPGKYQIRIHLARLVRQVGDYTRASQLVDEAVYGGAGTPSDLALRDIVAGDLAASLADQAMSPEGH